MNNKYLVEKINNYNKQGRAVASIVVFGYKLANSWAQVYADNKKNFEEVRIYNITRNKTIKIIK